MKRFLIMIAILWSTIFVSFVLAGIAESNYGPLWSHCQDKPMRIEYAFPGYRLGCWLGKRE